MAATAAKYVDPNDVDSPLNLVNRKILEIKKKIQLSEGQRKAQFEEADASKRCLRERTARLKREIAELKTKLKTNTRGNAEDVVASRIATSGKPEVPLKDRTCEQALEDADLKETELRKRLDLLRDVRRRRRQHMTSLARKFRDAVSMQANQDDRPDRAKSAGASLENRIHRARVLWFESEHVKRKYLRIRAALLADSARHDVRLAEAKAQETRQQQELDRLQAAHTEALRLRNSARALLQRRERAAAAAASTRAHRVAELRRQGEERRLELERLERRIFPTGGRTLVQQDSADMDQQNGSQQALSDENSRSKKEEAAMEELFIQLKSATGAATSDEVLQRFRSQRSSLERLLCLRRGSEQEKQRLERRREQKLAKLEAFKCDDVKTQEVSEEELEKTAKMIGEYDEEYEVNIADFRRTLDVIRIIRTALHSLCVRLEAFTDVSVPPEPKSSDVQDDGERLLQGLDQLSQLFRSKLLAAHERSEICTEPESGSEAADESKTEPAEHKITGPPKSYSELVEATKRPPVRSASHEKAAAGTDEEEEAPSRGFLKRQAQLIVDAKSRRKTFRAPRK